jgi:hypothetical protein
VGDHLTRTFYHARPPSPFNMIIARTEGYTYIVHRGSVGVVCLVQRLFSPRQALLVRDSHPNESRGGGRTSWRGRSGDSSGGGGGLWVRVRVSIVSVGVGVGVGVGASRTIGRLVPAARVDLSAAAAAAAAATAGAGAAAAAAATGAGAGAAGAGAAAAAASPLPTPRAESACVLAPRGSAAPVPRGTEMVDLRAVLAAPEGRVAAVVAAVLTAVVRRVAAAAAAGAGGGAVETSGSFCFARFDRRSSPLRSVAPAPRTS